MKRTIVDAPCRIVVFVRTKKDVISIE